MTKQMTPPRAQGPSWFSIRSEASQDVTKVYIFDAIDSWFGVSAQEFARELDDVDTGTIEIHVNSPGGAAWDGIAIANAIRQHQARTVTYVDGIAASAASVIAIASDEVVMSLGSQLMIHDGAGICWGNAADMEDMAEILSKLSDQYATLYQARAGGDRSAWRDLMRAETWYSAEEAVAAGLADRVDTRRPAEDDTTARFDLSVFAHAGRADAPAPKIAAAAALAAPKPPAEPVDHQETHRKDDTMSDALIAGLRQRLGIDPDANLDEDGLLAALDESLAEQTADPVSTTQTSIPEGTTLIDAEQLAELRSAADLGRQAREQQVAAERTTLVDAAITEGRISASRRDHWLAQLNADDEGARAVLASLEKNTIPVQAKGYTGGVDESTDDDALYSKAWGDTTQKGA